MAVQYFYGPAAAGTDENVLDMINVIALAQTGITFSERTVEETLASELALNPNSTPEALAESGYVLYRVTVERV